MTRRGSRILRNVILLFVALALATVIARYVVGPFYFAYTIERLNREKERQLLYKLDHQVLASELRKFASERRWNNTQHDSLFQYYRGNDPELPASLRALNPSKIRISDDRIEFECGGAFLSFGIAVFPSGIVGEGTKKLGEGVWFYAEDGQVPGA